MKRPTTRVGTQHPIGHVGIDVEEGLTPLDDRCSGSLTVAAEISQPIGQRHSEVELTEPRLGIGQRDPRPGVGRAEQVDDDATGTDLSHIGIDGWMTTDWRHLEAEDSTEQIKARSQVRHGELDGDKLRGGHGAMIPRRPVAVHTARCPEDR